MTEPFFCWVLHLQEILSLKLWGDAAGNTLKHILVVGENGRPRDRPTRKRVGVPATDFMVTRAKLLGTCIHNNMLDLKTHA